jgi:antitoxin (DNA-binding transcriptional repressor) of toxin-antitoxin stability system
MPTTEIKSSEVTRQIGHLFDRASRGETFAVTRYGRPLAVIAPPEDVLIARIAAVEALLDSYEESDRVSVESVRRALAAV